MKRLTLLLIPLAVFGVKIAGATSVQCADGSVAGYLAAAPCQFGPATVQLTSYSSTFAGVTADTSIVQFITRGNLVTLDIRPSSESGFSQYGSGTGSVTAQLVFDFPTATGGTGQMEFYAIDGCCVLGALGVPSFPGGAVKETITATTVAIIPLGGPNFDALEQVDSTYTSAFGSGSSHFLGESSGPFQLLEFTRPEFVQIPEPTTVWLLAPALLGLLVNRSLIKNR